ncbi:MAG TPA: 4-alpha-glucanotransferase, partial [Luteolibacter sp.]|nr:4-alpha-glucanotransferase [Luteolibacter sp.]
MKVVFRLNYVTVPGQSLWVRLQQRAGRWVELPMRWINRQQWELEHEVSRGPLRYSYQLRTEGSGVVIEEWGEGREVAPGKVGCLLLRDTWASAATIDYAYESKALKVLEPPRRGPFARLPKTATHSHVVSIRVAAVPAGQVLCLSGSGPALGSWDPCAALPMAEVAPNQWRVDLDLPAEELLEFKFGLLDEASGRVVELEGGENRVLEAHALASSQQTWIQDEGYRRNMQAFHRAAGVAVPVFSLRSRKGLGVGEFADLELLGEWAASVGLGVVQILPIHDTISAHDWTDSYPYAAISVFSLHPIYLRLDDLTYSMPADWHQRIAQRRAELNALEQVDHQAVMETKLQLTGEMFARHRDAIRELPALREFLDTHRDWLVPYAAFCALRDHYGTADFSRWDEDAGCRSEHLEEMLGQRDHPLHGPIWYWIWLQFELDAQLNRAVARLHERRVVLKGDLPIGVNRHSADAWSAPDLFRFEAQAGAPPDAFAQKGQNWGFPTYRWDRMRKDGFAWWRARFAHLGRYFDAFRIDHILGFFRIWQVPADQIEGIMGWFDPALPVTLDELRERGIAFDRERFCRPHLTLGALDEIYGDLLEEALESHLRSLEDGRFELREAVATQRRIADAFAGRSDERSSRMRQALMDCAAEVLFFEQPGSGGNAFHPRFFLQKTHSFAALEPRQQERVDALYIDYFFRRQDGFWRQCGLERLPALRRASGMLLCGEDLGLVPDCVPGVMRELGILSLEIQRMPKALGAEFGDPAAAPYLSVVSPSTHDMSTLRQWWDEEPKLTRRFAWLQLGLADPPAQLNGRTAAQILRQHLESPAMWAVFALQDWLAIDEDLRRPDAAAERINVPAIMPYHWRYRMHLDLELLCGAESFNHRVSCLLGAAQR